MKKCSLPGGRLLFLSPHLDDGAFACGRLLASVEGATVATVFAGRPPPGAPLSDWDRAAGFEAGDDVIARRRQEDALALGRLGATPRWLDLRDAQYGGADRAEVTAELRKLLAECQPDAFFIPLGLFHSDHCLAHEAALELLADYGAVTWFAYEDALYRRLDGLRDEALGRCRQKGIGLFPARFAEAPDAPRRKADAVACYRSQLRALATPGRPGAADLNAPEAHWRLILEEPL